MNIDFDKTGNLLEEHGKTYLKRRMQFRFKWETSIESNLDTIRRGFIFSDPDSFENSEFVQIEELNKISKWMIDTQGKGLALIGSSGRGKTMFLHGVLPHLLISRNKVPYSIKAADLGNYNHGKILLIDEVGREDMVFDKNKGKIDRFPMYVDYCVDSGFPLFFTSNLNKNEFTDRYGVHVYNRILSITNTIIFNGDSMWFKT